MLLMIFFSESIFYKGFFKESHQSIKQISIKLFCDGYGKCSKISNTFLFLFSNKMLVFRAGIHKFLVRVANREDPDQTASSEAV